MVNTVLSESSLERIHDVATSSLKLCPLLISMPNVIYYKEATDHEKQI